MTHTHTHTPIQTKANRPTHPPTRAHHSKQRVFKLRPGARIPDDLPAGFDAERDWYYSQIHTQVPGAATACAFEGRREGGGLDRAWEHWVPREGCVFALLLYARPSRI